MTQNAFICPVCNSLCDEHFHTQICPCCKTSFHHKKKLSLTKSYVFLSTAVCCYIPANMLPVMQTNLFGNTQNNTIMSGIIDFWLSGSYGIAAIIFIASVFIPCFKFLVLFFLLLSTKYQSQTGKSTRTKLYFFIDQIGYWSMLDVIVVAVISASIQFKSLSTVIPDYGILFFAAMVIFTMLATICYDPYLIWKDIES